MNERRPEKAYLNACCQTSFRRMATHFGFGPGCRAHLHNASSDWRLDDDGWTDLHSCCILKWRVDDCVVWSSLCGAESPPLGLEDTPFSPPFPLTLRELPLSTMNECRPEKAYLNARCQTLFRGMAHALRVRARIHLHNASSNWPLDDDGWTDLRSCCVLLKWRVEGLCGVGS
ncbi:hypothetical protein CDAR_412361 [Caerostris darwini]|uniref:Uncharacterized protein n=1 Tax=Caerostris darwini TaxID=1538125 RepID=A0AAV4SY40_9ARAC|nr:hypothetical protein CDAR_412361 [Caerostris darwini]